MKTHEFDKLTERYIAGLCTPDELVLLTKWADRVSQDSADVSAFVSSEEANESEARIWQRLDPSKEAEQKRFHLAFRRMPYPWTFLASVAACLVLILGLGIYLNNLSSTVAQQKHGIETRNSTTSVQKIHLTDGSTVVLQQNANIIVDEDFGKMNRTVHLTGEAFFDIARDEKMPFLVYSGGLVTEVLGTSFHIKPQSNGKAIEVSVKRGKVSVYASHSQKSGEFDGVILTPNQRVVYDVEHETIRQGIVDEPQILIKEKELPGFDFREETLDLVLERVQAAYGVEIVLPASGLSQCRFTGDLNGLTMHQQLKYICDSVGARLEIRGTTIFIFGNTCG